VLFQISTSTFAHRVIPAFENWCHSPLGVPHSFLRVCGLNLRHLHEFPSVRFSFPSRFYPSSGVQGFSGPNRHLALQHSSWLTVLLFKWPRRCFPLYFWHISVFPLSAQYRAFFFTSPVVNDSLPVPKIECAVTGLHLL